MKYNEKIKLIQGKKIFVGIDIARKYHYASFIRQNGEEIKVGFKFENNKEGFGSLIKELKKYKTTEIGISLEPTGIYWKSLAYYLQKEKYEVYLINPMHTKKAKELYDNQKSKNDKKDSKLIGHLLREGKFLKALLLKGTYANLRRLTNLRQRVVEDKTRIKNQLKCLLDEYLPEYRDNIKNIFSKTSVELMTKFSLEELRCQEHKEKIITSLRCFSRNQIKLERAKGIQNCLAESIGVSEGIKGADIELKYLLNQLQGYKKQLEKIEQEMEEYLKKTPEATYLLSIPGVGKITTAAFLGEVGALKKYKNAKNIEKLAGLDLVNDSSGTYFGKHHISKRGRSLLRFLLFRVTITAIAKNGLLKSIYERKVNTLKKPKILAITSLMPKMLRLMFAIGKGGILFQDGLYKASLCA